MSSRTVYLIHFERSIPGGKARHYVGNTENLQLRLQQHREGRSGPLFRIARGLGIGFDVVRTWEFADEQEAYDMERWLKEMRQVPRFCPCCTASPRSTNGHHVGACERYAGRLRQRRWLRDRYVQLRAGGLDHARIREIIKQEALSGAERGAVCIEY